MSNKDQVNMEPKEWKRIPLEINDVVYILSSFQPKRKEDIGLSAHKTIIKITITGINKEEILVGSKIQINYKYKGVPLNRKVKSIHKPERFCAENVNEMVYNSWYANSTEWRKETDIYLTHKEARTVKRVFMDNAFVQTPLIMINALLGRREIINKKGKLTLEELEKTYLKQLPMEWRNNQVFNYIMP